MATLTVGDITPRAQYTASSGQTVFAYAFPIFADGDLKVYIGPTLQTLTTHYTVSGAATSNGGNVTLVSGAGAGDIITIYRDLPVSRTSDYQTSGDLLAETLNDDFDKVVMMSQQVANKLDRTIQINDYDEDAALTLPNKIDRGSKYLAFNAGGDLVASSGTTSSFIVSSFIENSLLAVADVAAAQSALEVYSTSNLYTKNEVDANTQPLLVSGTTVKTISGQSILGAGNIQTELLHATKLASARVGKNMAAVMSDNTMQIWGDNLTYQLGIGNYSVADANEPITVSFPDNTSGKVSEIFISTGLTFALMDDGTVYGCGDNNGAYGSVGVGSTAAYIYVPTLVAFPISGVVITKIEISSGNQSASPSVYALDTFGRIWAWGYNLYGQLGDSTVAARTSPVRVKSPEGADTLGFIDISCTANGKYTVFYAISAASSNAAEDRRVMACGHNAASGVLCRGNLTNTAANLPNWVQDNAAGNAQLTTVTKCITSNPATTFCNVYFLTSAGKVYAAGENQFGQLGDGGTVDLKYAKEIAGLTFAGTVTDIATNPGGGQYTSCIALLSDGTVRTWGNNANGVLGNDTTTATGTPFQPVDNTSNTLTDIDRVWASGGGAYNTLYAKKDTGQILACGYNAHGECGRGNQDATKTFHTMFGTRFGGVDDFSDLAVVSYDVSGSTVFLLRDDGSVSVCGSDANEITGVNTRIEHLTFRKVHLLR